MNKSIEHVGNLSLGAPSYPVGTHYMYACQWNIGDKSIFFYSDSKPLLNATCYFGTVAIFKLRKKK